MPETPSPVMESPFPYGDIADLHKQVSETIPFFQGTTLPQFSAIMNKETGSRLFDQGLTDNMAKQYSHKLNQWLEPVSSRLGDVGAAVTSGVGLPQFAEQGRNLAAGLPRGAIEMGAIAAGTGLAALVAPEAGAAAGAAALGAKALPYLKMGGQALRAAGATSMGTGTYEQTGSPMAGVVAGGLGAVFPKFATAGEQVVQSLLKPVFYGADGAPKAALSGIAKFIEPAVEEVGRQVGMAANMEATIQGTSLASGRGVQNPLTPEHIFDIAAGAIPFSLLEMTKIATRPMFTAVIPGQEGRGDFRSNLERKMASAQTEREAVAAKTIADATKVVNQQSVLPKVTATDPEIARNVGNLPNANNAVDVQERVNLMGKKQTVQMMVHKVMERLQGQVLVHPDTVLQGIDPQYHTDITAGLEGKGFITPDETGMWVVKKFGKSDAQVLKEVRAAVTPETPAALAGMKAPEGTNWQTLEEFRAKGGAEKPSTLPPERPETLEQLIKQRDAAQGEVRRDLDNQIAHAQAQSVQTLYAEEVEGLRAQLEAQFGEKEPNLVTELLDAPPEVQMQQSQRLADTMVMHLSDALKVNALTSHDLSALRQSRQELRREVATRLELGEDPTTIAELIHKNNMDTIGRVVQLTKQYELEHAMAEKVPLDKTDMAKIERLTQLGAEHPGTLEVVNEVINGVLGYKESDLTGRIMGRVADFFDKPAVRKYWEDRAVKENPEGVTTLPHGANMAEFAKMPVTLREQKLALWQEQQKMQMGLKLFLTKDGYEALTKQRRKDKTVSESQMEPDAAEAFKTKTENVPAKSFEQTEMERAMFTVEQHQVGQVLTRAEPVTHEELVAAGVPFVRKAAEQTARFEAVRTMFSDGTLVRGNQKVHGRPSTEVGAGGDWDTITAQLGMENAKVLQTFIRTEFWPKIEALGRAALTPEKPVGLRAPAGGTPMEPSAKANIDTAIAEPKTKNAAFVLGAEAWFRTYFAGRATTKGEVDMMAGLAQKVALSFHDVGYTRVGELVGDQYMGISWRPWKDKGGIVAIAMKNWAGSPELDRMMKLATLGHEAFHSLVSARLLGQLSPEKTQMIDRVVAWALELSPEQRQDITRRYGGIIVPESLQTPEMKGLLMGRGMEAYDDAHEFLADFVGYAVLGQVSPDRETHVTYRKELMFDGPHEQQFIKGMFLPLFALTQSLTKFFDENVVTGERVTQPGEVLKSLSNELKGTLMDMAYVEKAQAQLNRIRSADLDNYYNLIADSVAGTVKQSDVDAYLMHYGVKPMGYAGMKVPTVLDDAANFLGFGATQREWERLNGAQPGFFARYFMPSAQLSKLYPVLQPVFDLVRSYRSLANLVGTTIAAPFMAKTSKWGFTHIDTESTGIKLLLRSKKAELVADQIRMDKQTERRIFDDQEMRKYGANLSEPEMKAVIDFHRAMEEAMPTALNMMVAYDYKHVIHMGAEMVMSGMRKQKTPVNHKAAIGLAEKLALTNAEMVRAQNAKDGVAYQQAATVQLQTLQEMGKAGADALEVMKPAWEQVGVKEKELSGAAWYMPEYRTGQYAVAWKQKNVLAGKPERTGMLRTDDLKKALDYKAQLEAKGVTGVHIWEPADKGTGGMNPELVVYYQNIERAAFDAALKALGEGTEMQAFRERFHYDPGETAMKEQLGRGLSRFTLHRELALGRETIDTVRTSIDYIQRLSTGLAKRHVTEQVNLALQNDDLQRNPKLLDLAQRHFQNVLNPTGPEWSLFKQLNFAYFMGFNFSSMAIEGTQGLITLIPQLTRDTGSIAKSYEAWGKGVQTSIDIMFKRKVDPELMTHIQRAIREQRIDFGTVQELYMAEDGAIPNLANLLHGEDYTNTAKDLAKKPLYWYLNASRWLYSQAPRANSYISFISLFKQAREDGVLVNGKKQKLDAEGAYQYAVSTTDATMFGGGAAARPVGMFNLLHGSKAYGAMGLLYSLGSYTYGTIGMLARLGKESIASSKMIAPTDKAAARKAFGQMLMTQTALGGALSLPFAGATLALINQYFPEVDAKLGLKEMLASLGGDDREMGEMISDIALKGAPSRYLNIDLSSRLALSQIMGISAYDGFSAKNLFGPTGSIVGNIASGVQQATSGNLASAAESIMPQPFKNALRVINDAGAIRDKAGNLIYEPTSGEAALYALGFKPKKLADFREQQQMIQRSDNVTRLEESRFYDTLADQYIAGDLGGVRQALQTRQQVDPMFDSVTGGHRVVAEVQKRTLPMDLTRTGPKAGAGVRAAIAPTGVVTETQRLLDKKRLESQLGLPGSQRMGAIELSLAQATDQLMMMNPAFGRQQALQMAEQMMGRTRPRAW